MDVFGFKLVMRCLREKCAGARAGEVFDLGKSRFGIELVKDGREYLFACSVSPESPAISLSAGPLDSAIRHTRTKETGNFQKALGFHLEGLSLTGVEEVEGERRATLTFEQRTEFGKLVARHLVIEIMGRHSGAFLLSEKGMVITIARKPPSHRNRLRNVLTGKIYPPPPPLTKPSPIGLSRDDFIAVLVKVAADAPGEPVVGALLRTFSGFTRNLVTGALEAAGLSQILKLSELDGGKGSLEKLCAVLESLESAEALARVIGAGDSADDALKFYMDAVLSQPAAGVRAGKTASENRFELRRERLKIELERVSGWKAISEVADRLMDSADPVKPITDEVRKTALELAESLGCKPSVSRFIAQRESAPIISSRLKKLSARYMRAQSKIEGLLASADSPKRKKTGMRETVKVATDEQKIISELKSLKKLGIKHRLYTSSDGVPIVLGLSARANEKLLKRYGSTPNWWFHARDVPGSWVIALTGKKPLPDKTRIEAAIIAARHSEDKDDSSVEVSYTMMKYLRKPKGAPAGRVLVRNEKAVSVNPGEFAKIKDRLQSP